MPDKLPGDGFLGWLGRQVGHVAKAVRTDVTVEAKAVHRDTAVEEVPHPTVPGVTLRRTTVDEVIVAPNAAGRTSLSIDR